MDDVSIARSSSGRRGTAYPDQLVLHRIFSEEDASIPASSITHSSLRHGTFQADNDAHLHALPRDLYDGLQGHVTAIKVSKCPLRYIGHNAAEEDAPKNLSISFFYRLTELRVTHCKLTDLPNGFEDLSLLEVIDVSFNILRTLPNSLGFAPNLKELNAANNLLCMPLPPSLLESRSLKRLHLQNNDLTPEDFPSSEDPILLSLKQLTIDEQAVKDGISPFPLKEKRFLRPGGIITIHPREHHVAILTRQSQTSSFDMIPPRFDREVAFAPTVKIHYRWLNLKGYEDEFCFGPTELLIKSSDHLSCLPTTSFSKVSQVIIENDPEVIQLLPVLQSLPNMRTLVLKGCGIKELPEDFFTGLASLKYLDLSENKLRFIPPSFSYAPALRFCIVNDNNITMFPEIPKNLLSLLINRNCLCIDNDPESHTNIIQTKQFAYARSLVQLEMADNCILPADFFPGSYGYPTQLALEIFKIDARAVQAGEEGHRTTLHMQDGCQSEYVTTPSKEWQARVQKEMKLFARTPLGKIKLGL